MFYRLLVDNYGILARPIFSVFLGTSSCQFVDPAPQKISRGKSSVRFSLPPQQYGTPNYAPKSDTDLQLLRKLKPKSSKNLSACSVSNTSSSLDLEPPEVPPRTRLGHHYNSMESLSSDGASTTSGSYVVDLSEPGFNPVTVSGIVV